MAKPSATTLSKVQSEIDTAVKKNLLVKNTAARRKAHYAKIAKEAGVKLATTAKAAPKAATTKTATKPAAAKKPAATKAPAAKKAPAKKTAK